MDGEYRGTVSTSLGAVSVCLMDIWATCGSNFIFQSIRVGSNKFGEKFEYEDRTIWEQRSFWELGSTAQIAGPLGFPSQISGDSDPGLQLITHLPLPRPRP